MNSLKKIAIGCFSMLLALPIIAADGLKHQDHAFVEKAAKAGMEEVAISRVAVDRSLNPQVKEFAQMMVSDHTDANTQLMALASAKGVKLPADDTNTKKWAGRNAKGFDEEYLEKMISDHKEAVKLFEEQAKDGTDPELKAFAAKTLPALLTHLDKVQALKKALK